MKSDDRAHGRAGHTIFDKAHQNTNAYRSNFNTQISFRRTDADRKPATPVRMPNDGPDPDREAKAAAIRERLAKKDNKL